MEYGFVAAIHEPPFCNLCDNGGMKNQNSMPVLDSLLRDVPTGWRVAGIDVGVNWVLVQLRHKDGTQRAGVANASQKFTSDMVYPIGHYEPDSDANTILPLLRSADESAT
jgi:hypothetical protein